MLSILKGKNGKQPVVHLKYLIISLNIKERTNVIQYHNQGSKCWAFKSLKVHSPSTAFTEWERGKNFDQGTKGYWLKAF